MDNTKVFEEIMAMKSLRKEGKGFVEIRTLLTEKGYSEDEIKTIIKNVNDLELKDVNNKSDMDKAFENMIFAIGVMLFGAGIMFYAYFNNLLSEGIYFIAFGPFIGGYLWFRKERSKYNAFKRQ